MAKRLKLRICRVINTTLQSCRSKDPSNLPQDPVPSFSSNHHLSSEQFKWKKEDKWHVVAKIYDKSSSGDDFTFAPLAPPPPSASEKKKRRGKKKIIRSNVPSKLRISTSSADSGWFSSDGGAGTGDERNEEETETLVSSFSTDYFFSEFNPNSQLQPIQENIQLFASTTNLPHTRSTTTNNKRVSKGNNKRGGAVKPPPSTAEADIPARLSMFKKLIPCTVDGKVKESFAIVKTSQNPYEDFKHSMMDMILEKQMFDQRDLEQLLECFLSLNSRNYHGIIVQAFSEIWEAIFSLQPPPAQYHPRVHRRASF